MLSWPSYFKPWGVFSLGCSRCGNSAHWHCCSEESTWQVQSRHSLISFHIPKITSCVSLWRSSRKLKSTIVKIIFASPLSHHKAVMKGIEGSGWGTHVNPWLFHFNVWQNPLQIKIKKKKKERNWGWLRKPLDWPSNFMLFQRHMFNEWSDFLPKVVIFHSLFFFLERRDEYILSVCPMLL